MTGTGRRMTGRRIATGVFALLMIAGLQGCGRNKFPLTPCVGDVPAIERTKDVAPPNCPAA